MTHFKVFRGSRWWETSRGHRSVVTISLRFDYFPATSPFRYRKVEVFEVFRFFGLQLLWSLSSRIDLQKFEKGV